MDFSWKSGEGREGVWQALLEGRTILLPLKCVVFGQRREELLPGHC